VSARSWTVEIPAPAPWLNANQRTDLRAQTPQRRAWRDAAHVWAQAARLPGLGRAHLIATLHFTDRRRRDTHNYYPTIKACVDGLIDYGLLPDDSAQYLTGPDLRLGEPIVSTKGKPHVGKLVIVIREVA